MASQGLSREGLILLLCLAVGWGINWPIMKVIVAEVPPLSFRGSCLFLGGLGILALARASGLRTRIPAGYLPKLLWLCLLNIIGWNLLATYGLSLLPAGRAALLGYTMPLWGVALSAWILREEFTRRHALAMLLGMGGILVLLGGTVNDLVRMPLGALLMIGAAWCWAAGMVLMKRWQIPLNTVALTGWLLLLASLPMLAGALVVDGLPRQWPSTPVILGLVYNVVVAFMLCYWAWNRLVILLPVSVSSLSSLLTPLIGVISGVIMLNERLGWQEYLAGALILGSLAVINIRSIRSSRDKPLTPTHTTHDH